VRITVLEVISGLGLGGAERAFLNRLRHVPDNFKTIILNTRPELNFWKAPPDFHQVKISRKKFSFIWRAKAFLAETKPDLIIVRTPVDLIIMSLLKIFTNQTFKLVFEAHSMRISNNRYLECVLYVPLSWSIRRADLTIAVSESVSLGPQSRYSKRTVVSYLGADIDIRSRLTKSVVFLFVGRFTALKQPLLLLDALLSMKSDFELANAKMVFLGAGELEVEMKNFVVSKKLSSIVSILGYQRDLNSFYSDADYLVSTSRYEGLPISFFEAKLHGLKIITTPSSGNFDILTSDDTLLPNFSRASIVSALSDAVKLGPISLEDRDFIRRKSSWMNSESCSREYYKILQTELIPRN